jgi:opacity protein-like surface antigen
MGFMVMNANKILGIALASAVAAASSFAAPCGNGGFYVGVDAGVNFSKVKVQSTTHYDTATEHHKAGQSCTVEKEKVQPAAKIYVGVDKRINDVKIGADLGFGMDFGKLKRVYDGWGADDSKDGRDEVQVKQTWNITLMPRLGYLVLPELEIYATAGAKLAHFKTTYVDVIPTDAGQDGPDSKKCCRIIPVVGAGVRWDFTPNWFAKLEYNFEIRTKLKMPTSLAEKNENPGFAGNANAVKRHSHAVKVGVGYRF